jgi:hypothetical protein
MIACFKTKVSGYLRFISKKKRTWNITGLVIIMTNKYYDFVSPYPDKSLAVQAIKNIQQAANSQIHFEASSHVCVWGGGGGGGRGIFKIFVTNRVLSMPIMHLTR